MLTYGSVCSGIEAASVAWKPLGWRAAFVSEIAEFPRAVLQHHHPNTPLRGDFSEINNGDHDAIDLLVGGTPCQSFSHAGLRHGLRDGRGNLCLEFLRLADRLGPRWVLWENVPGVLSSDRGRDFAAYLGGLGELGYQYAYRVLDAQHWGVPQQRRRLFVIGHRGDGSRPAEVLFEPGGGGVGPAPRRNPEKVVAALTAAGVGTCGADDNQAQAGHLIADGHGVRRLTPRECERLMGFPDDYTLMPGGFADHHRYRALGNSMAVPVMRWIGERIARAEAAHHGLRLAA